jgi:hypothetical protein
MVVSAGVFMSNEFWQIRDIETAIVRMNDDLHKLLKPT